MIFEISHFLKKDFFSNKWSIILKSFEKYFEVGGNGVLFRLNAIKLLFVSIGLTFGSLLITFSRNGLQIETQFDSKLSKKQINE